MKEILPQLPALVVVVPLLGAVISAFLRAGILAWAWATAITFATAVLSVLLLIEVKSTGTMSYFFGGWTPAAYKDAIHPIGIEYRVDILSAFIAVLVATVAAAMMPFARRSVAFEIEGDKQPWFYTMYLTCFAGLLGISLTGDAFNVFVFLEISSLATYALIATGRDRRALVSAYQYLILGTIGATLYVIGVGLLYVTTGSLNLLDISNRLELASADYYRPVIAALAFMLVGISLKLALFPLHGWLPNAYAYAPSFASAFLAATATKVAVYLLLRMIFSVFDISVDIENLNIREVIVVLSIAAMFIASILAVFESNLKRMLAFSSLAQIGYITLGIAIANTSGLTGSIVHLFNHALMKGALFLALGAVFYRVGTVRLENLGGIGRQMPVTFAVFMIAGLALIGVPGTAGFISKWYLAVGAFEAGWWPVAFLIVASSLIAVVYVGRVIEAVYFQPASEAVSKASDPPPMMMISMLILGLAVIVFGIYTEWSAGIANLAAAALMEGRY
ncbi:MAG: hypothetical protein RLZ98_2894 [Pseudomonadota bacterium]|jgi:multicomponent Na+:H+ antiporter subunit D